MVRKQSCIVRRLPTVSFRPFNCRRVKLNRFPAIGAFHGCTFSHFPSLARSSFDLYPRNVASSRRSTVDRFKYPRWPLSKICFRKAWPLKFVVISAMSDSVKTSIKICLSSLSAVSIFSNSSMITPTRARFQHVPACQYMRKA